MRRERCDYDDVMTPTDPCELGWTWRVGRTWQRPDGSLHTFPAHQPQVVWLRNITPEPA